ncbi:helix-turn-helix domain-containing protein [Pseudomonas sp. LS1212]|uniref:ArsR/SmtB family transcription factor n=1 Tax=Pseudomonas sp. LS1212 TaxID=2972478 RepID=UPI00215C8B05|nr:metalloregulator ArsR/SmtB family transcription factor [Pseudomonas sp. LS1212]UVJ44607.1 helix-turn-helix domain-containing protein [Pseudomonas sp. LS1212]
MKHIPCISQIATLLADPKRSAMLWALIDGTARASEELASLAGLSPSSASAHLARLSAGGLLKREARGRQRFFRLAAPEVGAAVEALASVSVANNAPYDTGETALDLPAAPLSMRKARICRDHLSGDLAAELYQRMIDAQWIESLDHRLEVTAKGSLELANYGIYIQALARREKQTLCTCRSDWSDRRPHLGGALGASLLKLFIQSGWLKLNDGHRAVQVTAVGLKEIGKIASHCTSEVSN